MVRIMPLTACIAPLGASAIAIRNMHRGYTPLPRESQRLEEGDVIVIDAGGVPPALWGELATHSAVQRKLAGWKPGDNTPPPKPSFPERGVRTDAMTAVGYGEGQPIASNDVPEGRAENRRITFEWTGATQ